MEEKRSFKILKDYYIGLMQSKKESRIGVEFEYLLASREKISYKKIGTEFMESLLTTGDFEDFCKNDDGLITSVSNKVDTISFDVYYSTIEFSLAPRRNLWEIYDSWKKYITLAKNFYEKHGVFLSGIGENRFNDIDYESVKYEGMYFVNAINEEFGENRVLRSVSHISSIQTHLDINCDDFIKAYNLANEMFFIDALLFANSPAVVDGQKYLLYRDEEWQQAGFDTEIFDCKFNDFDELFSEIIKEKQYITYKNGQVKSIRPSSLIKYYDEEGASEEEIRYFRSFREIILNKYGCLEFRGDCTQPVKDCLITTAFHLGISGNLDKAEIIMAQMKDELKLTESNSQLRKKVIRSEKIGDEEKVKKYLCLFRDCAVEGLKKRNLGEEKFLEGLDSRIESFESPAKTFLRKLEEGYDVCDLEESMGSGKL